MKDVTFSYNGTEMILENFNLKVDPSEMYTVLGGSGSGKTTLLQLIAGFLKPLEGKVLIGGKDATYLPPEKRNVGMVFQNYALFPHLDVIHNVIYGVDPRRKDRRQFARKMLALVGLEGMEKRSVNDISGGQKQRIALARALAHEPDVMLLDEPLSALDTSLREGLRKELRSILKESSVTTLYITHDQVEALSLSDRIGFLHGGKILEENSPDGLYWAPKREETALFMGIPNIFNVERKKGGSISTPVGSFDWMGEVPKKICFRPESLSLENGSSNMKCIVTNAEYRGKEQMLDVRYKKYSLRVFVRGKRRFTPGDKIELGLSKDSLIPLWS